MKRIALLLISLFLTVGCQTDFQKLESLYFNDNYIDAILLAQKMSQNPQTKEDLDKFLNTHYRFLSDNLLEAISNLSDNPSTDQVEDLSKLLPALHSLQSVFPNYIAHDLIKNIRRIQEDRLSVYLSDSLTSTDIFLKNKQYHHALQTLKTTKESSPLPQHYQQLISTLENYLKRTLYIPTIKVHDKPLEALIKQYNLSPTLDYTSAPSDLLMESLNVPKTFERELIHYLNKGLIPSIQINNHSKPHYTLYCTIGLRTEQPLDKKRKEITNTFYIQLDDQEEWIPQEISYEIDSQEQKAYAIVSAELQLNNPKQTIGRYIFETIATHELVTIGEFINLPANMTNIRHSTEYKNYQTPHIPQSIDTLSRKALDDAGYTLSKKIIETITSDPDPWAATHPLASQAKNFN